MFQNWICTMMRLKSLPRLTLMISALLLLSACMGSKSGGSVDQTKYDQKSKQAMVLFGIRAGPKLARPCRWRRRGDDLVEQL